MLQCENLSKSFSGRKILDGTSLAVEPGKLALLIGPSGSGKSTLLRALALLDHPDGGDIYFDQRKYTFPLARGEKPPKPWPGITVVFQQLFLWPHLTLRQNITLPIALRYQEERTEQLDKFIEMFSMAEFIDRYPNQASLGQRQRTALVRALMLQPQYILLDEITSSLDVEQTAIILRYLQELKGTGIGILAITHLLHFAEEAADEIYFMDQGKIVESGGPEILRSPKNERLQQFLSVVKEAS